METSPDRPGATVPSWAAPETPALSTDPQESRARWQAATAAVASPSPLILPVGEVRRRDATPTALLAHQCTVTVPCISMPLASAGYLSHKCPTQPGNPPTHTHTPTNRWIWHVPGSDVPAAPSGWRVVWRVVHVHHCGRGNEQRHGGEQPSGWDRCAAPAALAELG